MMYDIHFNMEAMYQHCINDQCFIYYFNNYGFIIINIPVCYIMLIESMFYAVWVGIGINFFYLIYHRLFSFSIM